VAAKGGKNTGMSALVLENLQLQALEQRNRLHLKANELRSKLWTTREKLNVKKQAHDHLLAASILAAVVGLSAGYRSGAMFTKG
jgi:hypothetical protein